MMSDNPTPPQTPPTATPTPAAAPPPPPPSRNGCGCSGCGCGTLVIGCLGVMATIVVLMVAVVGFVWWQLTTMPEYWETRQAQVQQLSPTERDQRAEQLEQRLTGWFSDAGQADPQTNYAASPGPSAEGERRLRLTFDDVNIWLDRRLDQWAQQQDVDFDLPMRSFIVTSENGRLILAGDVDTPAFRQVVSLTLDAQMLPDGDMRVRVDRMRLGRISLPVDTVIAYLRTQLPEDESNNDFRQVVEAMDGYTFTPVFKQDDTREMRVTDWRVDDEGVDLTVVTGPRSREE